jgi:hypothetical protein
MGKIQGPTHGRGKKIFFSPQCLEQLWWLASYQMGTSDSMKGRQPFVWLEYIFLKKENVYLTTCFSLSGHHQVFLQFLFIIQRKLCSLVVLVIVCRIMFLTQTKQRKPHQP